MSYHVRWMIRRDVPEVLNIEENGWDEADLIEKLRQRNCIGMVVEKGEKIIGFMVYELYEKKIVLLRMKTHLQYRRQGVGTTMIKKIMSKFTTENKRTRLVCDVDDSNLGAHLFLKAVGAEAIRVNREDETYRFVLRKRESVTA